MHARARALHTITGTLRWDPAIGTLTVGAVGEIARSFSIDDVRSYASLCGDNNPLHLDEAFAKGTRFGRRVVHGMLHSSLFGTILGAQIPGSVYVSQSLSFKRPVFIDEPIIARVEVTSIKYSPRHFVTCATTLRSAADGRVCVEGQAVLMLPSLPSPTERESKRDPDLL